MQTHRDSDFPAPRPEWLDKALAPDPRLAALEDRAREMIRLRESEITAGRPGEQSVAECNRFCVYIRRLPDDPECLRISIGEVPGMGDETRYLVLRGNPAHCADLLERAARALRASVGELTP